MHYIIYNIYNAYLKNEETKITILNEVMNIIINK